MQNINTETMSAKQMSFGIKWNNNINKRSTVVFVNWIT